MTNNYWGLTQKTTEANMMKWVINFESINMSKKFLIPVSAAVTALVSNSSYGINNPQSIEQNNNISNTIPSNSNSSINLKRYSKNGELHEILMKKTDDGILFAQHRSHYSHSSHSSHRSSR